LYESVSALFDVTSELMRTIMATPLPQEWNSLSELIFALRRDDYLTGGFETELLNPETGASLGKARMPPFLYRGEPAVYDSTMGGLWRAQSFLSHDDFECIQKLVLSAAVSLSEKSREPLPFGEAIAYAQHYGFFTPLVDVSSSVYVSAHFAAGSNAAENPSDDSKYGTFMRINLRRAQQHLELLRPTMLGGRFARPSIQQAWTIEPPAAVGDREGERREDDYWRNLKSAFFSESGIIETLRWQRNPKQDPLFYNPFLNCPPDDPYIGWPVLLVNQFVEKNGPISNAVATLLLGRLPLYQMVCFSRDDGVSEPNDGHVKVPSELFCAGVHPGRVWNREYLHRQWTGA
jgi:hypothetical protein